MRASVAMTMSCTHWRNAPAHRSQVEQHTLAATGPLSQIAELISEHQHQCEQGT